MKKLPPFILMICFSLLLSKITGWSQEVQTIKDVNTTSLEPSPTDNEEMVAVGNRLYLATDDEVVGSELWSLNVAGKLNSPQGLFLNSTGNVFIADAGNHTIREFNVATGSVTTRLGQAGRPGFANRIGLATVLSSPKAIAFDTSGSNPPGTYFVADTANHVIRKITPAGVVTVFAGTSQQTGSNDGSSNTRFNSPEGISIDGAGNIFVADTGNHVIRMITKDGVVSTFAGGAGLVGSADGSGTAARFSSPRGIAVRPLTAEVFVADTGNHTIRRISGARAVTTLAGTAGSSGTADGTKTAARFSSPEAITIGGGSNLFVADTGNHTIRQIVATNNFPATDGVVTTLAGSAGASGYSNATGTSARFNAPAGIAADGLNNVYVADTQNHVLRKVTSAGVTTTIVGVPNNLGGDDGVANSAGLASTPSVVKDILPGSQGSQPKSLIAVSSATIPGSLFFTAKDADDNIDLWNSDGTASGTKMVQDIPYESNQGPEKMTSFNGNLYFEGFDNANGKGLWRTKRKSGGGLDGAERVALNGDLQAGAIDNLIVIDATTLCLTADRGAAFGSELLKVTATGVTPVSSWLNVPPANFEGASWSFRDLRVFGGGGKLCFVATGIDPGTGNGAGTELFSVDVGTKELSLVKDIVSDLASSDPAQLTISGSPTSGTLFFVATSVNEGPELWSTTTALDTENTKLVKDIYPGTDPSNIQNLTPIVVLNGTASSNRVVFTATDGTVAGKELWQSDGTADGTLLLKDITPAETNDGNSVLSNFVNLGPNLVIFTQEVNGQLILWRTDGTPIGTVVIEDFVAEPGRDDEPVGTAVAFRKPTVIGNTLYFMLGDDQLWKTTGASDDSTIRVQRFRQATAGSGSQHFTQLADGRVAFSSFSGSLGREPWITDGTESGTTLLENIASGADSSNPTNFTPGSGGRFFFTASPTGTTSELYVVNGTTVEMLKKINESGDSEVTDLYWNPNSSSTQVPAIEPTLYFSANDASGFTSNKELWKSSGAAGNAVKVKEIKESLEESSDPNGFTAIGTTVYFAATGNLDRELYRTDGTSLGTKLVKDINPGENNPSNPKEFVVGPGNKLFFVATGRSINDALQNTGREIWVSDGTEGGTKALKNINFEDADAIEDSAFTDLTPKAYLTVVGNLLYFVADDGSHGKELWQSNGTEAGTKMVKDLRTGEVGSDPTELRNVNGKLFFLADDGVNGRELWTLGTTGPVMVSTGSRTGLVTGSGSANIQHLTVVNDVVAFAANDEFLGREIWMSNGTTAGTRILSDFLPGGNSSNPSSLFAFKANLIFSAADAALGDEPRFAFVAPKISIEYSTAVPSLPLPSDGSARVTPNPSSVAFGQSSTLSLTIKNNGINNLRNVTALISGLHAAEFTITTKPPTTIANTETPKVVLTFKPREGGERVAKLTILSSDPEIPAFVIQLSADCKKETTVTAQPAFAHFVKVGAPVTLAASAVSETPKPLVLQWRRNGIAAAGAVTNPLLLKADLTNAGIYTAQFVNSTPATLPGTGTSDPAHLAVVEDFSPARIQAIRQTTATSTTTIEVKAASSATTLPLRYQWKRSADSSLSNPELLVNSTPLAITKFKNVTTSKLTITGAVAADSGYYFCEVTEFDFDGIPANDRVLTGGTTELRVFTAAPVVTPSQTLPVGVVGVNYFYQIRVDAAPTKAPTTFTAKTLPAGLRIDAKTGIISGVPTKAGVTNVLITATNGVLPNLVGETVTLTIVDVPTGLDGTYTGLIDREPNLNENLGGRIDLTVTKATGAFSGSLTMGVLNHKFTGWLGFGISSSPTPSAIPPYTATVTVSRGLILAPLTLTFTIDDTTKTLLSGQVSVGPPNGAVTAPVSGWKQIRKATPASESAFAYAGLYNFGIRLPAQVNSVANPNIADPRVPQGNGYGSFTVAAAGTLAMAGRTPDGETLTGGTFVGPTGQLLFFQTLYATSRRGSIHGLLQLGTENLADTTDNTLVSTRLDWVRPANPAAVSATTSTRTYRAGFGLSGTPVVTPVELEAFGGRYVPPTTLLNISGAPAAKPIPTSANAEVIFTQGGLPSGAGASSNPNLDVAVTATNTIVVFGSNLAKTAITPTRTTGVISGKFSLSDPNARTLAPLTPNPILRAVTFQGLIVPDNVADTHEGVGYFMLPQLPTADNATLITTTPILSGKMIFKKKP
jgi:ELWxxDGT repeat protein